ncbi:chitin synthase-domain-containing protein [Syncephalis fuscata]|nr:chitin synthase-domain-containing protein [Syncephalis fuscata]
MSNPVATIFDAILVNDVDLIRNVLEKSPYDLNIIRNRDGRTPLMVACQTPGADQVVQYFCNMRNVDVDLRDNDGESALYQASAAGNHSSVEVLVRAGAKVDLGNNEQITPLMIAAYNGHRSVCEILVELAQANVHHRDNSAKTALVLASYEGHASVVQYLIEQGAELNTTDQYGWTALMLAAYAVATSNDKTAYVLAREAGCDEVIALLTEHQHTNASDVGITLRYGVAGSAVSVSGNNAYPERAEANTVPVSGTAMPASSSPRPPPLPNKPSPSAVKSAISGGSGSQVTEMRSAVSNRTRASGPGRATMGRAPRKATAKRTGLRSRRQRNNLPNFSASPGSLGGALEAQANYPQMAYTNLRQHPRGLAAAAASRLLSNGTEKRGIWEWFSQGITACCFDAALNHFGGLRAPNVRQAWREKVALCFIILCISVILGFLTFGFSGLACQKIVPIFPAEVAAKHGVEAAIGQRYMTVRGRLFHLGDYFEYGFHRPITPLTDKDLATVIDPLYGNDISDFFPPKRQQSGCSRWPTSSTANDCQLKTTRPSISKAEYLHCHTSSASQQDLMRYATDQYVAFSWDNITESKSLLVYNQRVYDLSSYFNANQTYLGNDATEELRKMAGRDASRQISRSQTLIDLVPCLDAQFMVGRVDGTTIGCFASNLLLIALTTILIVITIIKFVAAIAFDWFLGWKLGKVSTKARSPDTISHVMVLVTCYSEDEAGLRTTFDSIARSTYSNDHRLLFVIADGDVTGAGNGASTPDLCIKVMDRDANSPTPTPCSYTAIGDGVKQHNMAQVYIGHYACDDIRLPYLLIVKCGTLKNGLLVLKQAIVETRLTAYSNAVDAALTGVTPDKYDMVLMVDADTLVMPDALSYMVAAMERDPTVMGLCGETRVANKRQSWVTMIQVYEYYISHHLGKAFESIFGGVTCLPGCFCMYRIKAPKCDGYSVPVLANPDIVEMYSSNDTSTLHKKNLLLLGEDRYLTTLMLRAFPKRKMIYVPKAVCRTIVPDEFRVLLSQRRRWINSTIHNLFELILVPELCGIFCCSMHFIIFMELIGTVVLPAAFIFLLALIVAGIAGTDVGLPLLFMCATLMLQAFLVLVTTRKGVYVMWMGVFLLGMPIWNLVLPLYAFWHFDDFSWGATRKVDGPDGHGHGDGSGKTDEFNPDVIPMRRWHEWVAEGRGEQATITELNEPALQSTKYNQYAHTPSSGSSSYGNNYTDPLANKSPILSMPEPTIPGLQQPSSPLQVQSQPPLQGGYSQISAPYTPAPAAGSVVSEATASWLAYASEALKMPTPMAMTNSNGNSNSTMADPSLARPEIATPANDPLSARPPYTPPVMPIARTDIYNGGPTSSATSFQQQLHHNSSSSNVGGPRGPRERPETPRRR